MFHLLLHRLERWISALEAENIPCCNKICQIRRLHEPNHHCRFQTKKIESFHEVEARIFVEISEFLNYREISIDPYRLFPNIVSKEKEKQRLWNGVADEERLVNCIVLRP